MSIRFLSIVLKNKLTGGVIFLINNTSIFTLCSEVKKIMIVKHRYQRIFMRLYLHNLGQRKDKKAESVFFSQH